MSVIVNKKTITSVGEESEGGESAMVEMLVAMDNLRR